MVLSAEAVAALPPNAGAEEKFFALADLASPNAHHLGAESDVTPLRQPLAKTQSARPKSATVTPVQRRTGRRLSLFLPERGGNLRCATDAVDLFMPVLPMVWIDSRPLIPPPLRAATSAGLPELGNRTCGRAESTSPEANAPGRTQPAAYATAVRESGQPKNGAGRQFSPASRPDSSSVVGTEKASSQRGTAGKRIPFSIIFLQPQTACRPRPSQPRCRTH